MRKLTLAVGAATATLVLLLAGGLTILGPVEQRYRLVGLVAFELAAPVLLSAR